VGIVGGGAAGTELAMAMAHHWQRLPVETRPQVHLIQQGEGLPEHYPRRAQRIIAKHFRAYGITVHPKTTVERVHQAGLDCSTGSIALDEVCWCPHAAAPAWPGASGIQTNEQGFIAVADTLQSLSHPWIFAAGDIAHLVSQPHPKAGVYAVRHAPVLFANLQ